MRQLSERKSGCVNALLGDGLACFDAEAYSCDAFVVSSGVLVHHSGLLPVVPEVSLASELLNLTASRGVDRGRVTGPCRSRAVGTLPVVPFEHPPFLTSRGYDRDAPPNAGYYCLFTDRSAAGFERPTRHSSERGPGDREDDASQGIVA